MKEDLVAMLFEVPGETVRVHKGDSLFSEGDPAEHFYIVKSGIISIKKFVSTGHVLALRLVSEGNIIGELPLYGDEDSSEYIFNAIAKTDAEVYSIRYEVLEQYLEAHPKLAIGLLKILSEHMRKQHSKYRDLILYGKKGAFYSTLVRLVNSYGVKQADGIYISVALTNQELAEFCSTSRESLNRMVSELRKKGVVSYEKHHLVIHDMDYIMNDINCEGCDKSICNID